MEYTKADFGDDFKWGVSTAAYQIEGAHNVDGKGASIWDHFAKQKRKITNNNHGDEACDFYNRYVEDILMLDHLNIREFRFSIAWSRIMPEGRGAQSKAGIAFYNRVINLCLELNITPWVTLYHWDLPQQLELEGGWTNRDVVSWFSDYVYCCVSHFGDRVKHWMVLNEPLVFTGAGYFLGVHAPGKKGLSTFLAAAHHAALSQAEGGRIIKDLYSDSKVGTTFSYSHIDAASDRIKDVAAAVKVDALLNRLFIEPLLGLGYPLPELKFLQAIENYVKPGDECRLAFEMDFIGLQNYTREVVAHAPFVPALRARIIKANKRAVNHTVMNWEVYPPAIYHALKRLDGYAGVKQIIVTENGAAFTDIIVNNRIDDAERIAFLKAYIGEVLRAKKEGVKVNGYFVWTLLDNFEWAEGYHPKFGLIHVDFKTQKRIVKASGKWYSELISS